MSDRFDFEQQIMECWKLVDEIQFISEDMVKNGLASRQQLCDLLESQAFLYDAKFNKMFQTFSELIKKKQI